MREMRLRSETLRDVGLWLDMDMEVMAIKASSEFGRLETASAPTRRQKLKKQKAWRKKNCFVNPLPDGTNFKFVGWKKYNTEFTCNLDYYVTLEAMDPACNSVFSFQTLLSDAGFISSDTCDIDTWRILACRSRCNKPVDDYWDRDEEMDKFYTCPMPKWFSDEALASDKKKYYVVQESELHENDWLHLFMEFAFFSKASYKLVATPPLEINMVVVETKEEYITEAGEKLHAENAIFYISYKYRGVSSSGLAGDHKAIIRKTMDGKPEHMSLEVAYELTEE